MSLLLTLWRRIRQFLILVVIQSCWSWVSFRWWMRCWYHFLSFDVLGRDSIDRCGCLPNFAIILVLYTRIHFCDIASLMIIGSFEWKRILDCEWLRRWGALYQCRSFAPIRSLDRRSLRRCAHICLILNRVRTALVFQWDSRWNLLAGRGGVCCWLDKVHLVLIRV